MALKFTFNPLSGNFDEISTVDLAPVGTTPNANGASISASQVLNLEPADATNPGVISTVAQDIPGPKTFLEPIVIESNVSDALVRYEPIGAITPSNVAWQAGFEIGQPYFNIAMDDGSTITPQISFGLNGIISVVSPQIFYSDNIRADNIATPAGAEVINVTNRQLKDTSSNVVAEFSSPTLVLTVGIDSVTTGGTDTLDIGATNAEVINIGRTSFPVNVLGSTLDVSTNLNLQGATSGNFTQQAAAVTTDYTVSWPAAQGAASDVLTNDGSGNLSWAPASAGGGYTSFAFANNQATPADVTGFLVDSSVSNGFVTDMSILRIMNDVPPVGDLDTAFEANLGTSFAGQVIGLTTDPSNEDVIAGGSFTSFNGNTTARIVRLNKLGVEDATFTTNVGTGFGGLVRSIGVDSNLKLVIGGDFTSFNGNTRRKLIRLNADGTEDATFIANLGTAFPTGTDVHSVAVQSDDAIVAVGNFATFNAGAPARIVRLNADGTTDATFSANVGTGLNATGEFASIQADGKILVGGSFTTINGVTVAQGLIRLNTDGTLDTTFDGNLGTGFDQIVTCVREQPDNKIVVTGAFLNFNGNPRVSMVRLNSDGTEDTTFYTNLGTSFDAPVLSFILQAGDDKIMAGGTFTTFNGNGLPFIVRLNPDGTEDTAFTTLAGAGPDSTINRFATSVTGAVLAGGNFTTYDGASALKLLEFDVVPELDQTMTFYGSYSNQNLMWRISDPVGAFDDAGVEFSITAVGQLQYTSSNMLGVSDTQEMRFLIRRL